jgi:hypothetical protein
MHYGFFIGDKEISSFVLGSHGQVRIVYHSCNLDTDVLMYRIRCLHRSQTPCFYWGFINDCVTGGKNTSTCFSTVQSSHSTLLVLGQAPPYMNGGYGAFFAFIASNFSLIVDGFWRLVSSRQAKDETRLRIQARLMNHVSFEHFNLFLWLYWFIWRLIISYRLCIIVVQLVLALNHSIMYDNHWNNIWFKYQSEYYPTHSLPTHLDY